MTSRPLEGHSFRIRQINAYQFMILCECTWSETVEKRFAAFELHDKHVAEIRRRQN